MNTDVMFSSKSDLWSTPQELFDELNAEFGFTLDTCALPENAKCARYYTPEINGLVQKWEGVCWCNPPYGRQIGKWVQKAATTNALVVMLLPARTDTKWFHDYIYHKSNVAVRFIRGRLKFGGAQSSAPFPSMVVIFNGRTNMDRLTDRRTAQQVRENIEKLQAKGFEVSISDLRYIKLADYENKEENAMNINGRWYTETEAQAYIITLEHKNAALEDKHLSECRQISEYDIEVRTLREQQNVNDKLERITANYTFGQQRQVFAEECAEGIQAAMKLSRAETVDAYEKASDALVSEVADVIITAEQMRLYLGVEKVDAEIQRKLDRQIQRIKEEQEYENT